MRFAYLSEIDDGWLDVIVIKGDRPIETAPDDLSFHQAQHEGLSGRNVHFKSRDILLHSYNEETTDIDGSRVPGFRCASRANREPCA